MPGSRADVSAMRHDRKLRPRVALIGKSVYIELFDEHFGGDEQLHGAENAAVVREVAGAASREHVEVEGIVHADDERISVPRGVADFLGARVSADAPATPVAKVAVPMRNLRREVK